MIDITNKKFTHRAEIDSQIVKINKKEIIDIHINIKVSKVDVFKELIQLIIII
ncbi:hypothetical protein LBMAG27_07310 [Bacteroidota bacterium]|nr:hypothetical protein LBMAG27_07310 [Bacteroidota bacterium]